MTSTFNEDRAEFARHDGNLTTALEVRVSAEDDAEVRRVSISNSGSRRARHRNHLLWRAGAGTAGRRCRASGVFQVVCRDRISRRTSAPSLRPGGRGSRTNPRSGPRISPSSMAKRSANPQYRDRQGALPRPRTALERRRPQWSTAPRCPIRSAPCSIRFSRCADVLRVAPGATARVAFWTMVAATREGARALSTSIGTRAAFERASDAGVDAGAGATAPSRHQAGRSAAFSNVLQATPLFRSPVMRPSSDGSSRWRRSAIRTVGAGHFGRSADRAIAHRRGRRLECRRQLLQAHEYWRMKQLAVDLVILNERKSSYVQDLQIAHRNAGAHRANPACIRDAATRAAGLRPSGGPDCRRRRALLLLGRPRCACGAARNLSDQLDRIAAHRDASTRLRSEATARPSKLPTACHSPSWNSSTGWADLPTMAANM